MMLYTVIWEDRHSESTAHPFTDKEAAIAEAKRVAKKYAREEEDYEEHDYAGCVFYAEYSCEGDHTRVVETELDKKLEQD